MPGLTQLKSPKREKPPTSSSQPLNDLLVSILADMKDQIKDAKEVSEDLDSAHWNYQEGVIVSANNAQKIIDFIEGN